MLSKIRVLSIVLLTNFAVTACDAPADAKVQASAVTEQKLVNLRTTILADSQEAAAFLEDPGTYLEGYDILVGPEELEHIRGVINERVDDRDIAALEMGFRATPKWLRELIQLIIEIILEHLL